MLLLTINTASRNHELLLVRDTELLAHDSWLSQRDEATTLLPRIEQLLLDQKSQLSDLTHLLVITGPGGFTSLRVGITLANALTYSLKLQTAGLTLFEWWKNKLGRTEDYLLVSSAGGETVFVGGYDDQCSLVSVDDVREKISNSPIALKGELMEKHLSHFPTWQDPKMHELKPDLGGLLEAVQFEKDSGVEAWYGRGAV